MTHHDQGRPTATPRPIPGAHTPKTGQSDAKPEVVSLPRVTRVTRNYRFVLRARVRRPNLKTYVTHVISTLTSDTSDTKLQLSVPLRAHALAVLLNKTHVTSVTRLERPPK